MGMRLLLLAALAVAAPADLARRECGYAQSLDWMIPSGLVSDRRTNEGLPPESVIEVSRLPWRGDGVWGPPSGAWRAVEGLLLQTRRFGRITLGPRRTLYGGYEAWELGRSVLDEKSDARLREHYFFVQRRWGVSIVRYAAPEAGFEDGAFYFQWGDPAVPLPWEPLAEPRDVPPLLLAAALIGSLWRLRARRPRAGA